MSPSRYWIDRNDVPAFDNSRRVEIIHRGADMTRNEVKYAPDRRNAFAIQDFKRKVFLARLQPFQSGPAKHHSARYTAIHSDAFVAGITGGDPCLRMADYSADYQHSRLKIILVW